MTVYHTLVVLVLLAALLMQGNRKKNLMYLIVATALMFCVMGLRHPYTIGVDSTTTYYQQFKWAGDADWKDLKGLTDWLGMSNGNGESEDAHSRNVGLQWLMKIVYELSGGEYHVFIEVYSMIVLLSVAWFIYRFSPSPMFSVILFWGLMFYPFHFSALKQSIAMSFILIAAGAVVDRKPLLFFFMTLVATMFHFPAMIFLPAYLIGNLRLGRTYLFVLAGLFVFTYLFRSQLLKLMTDTYNTTIYESDMRFLANKVIVQIVIIILAVVVRPPVLSDRTYNTFLMLIGVATVLQTFAKYNNTFERLADYYWQTSIVFIPMIFENVDIKQSILNKSTTISIRKVMPVLICAFAIWRFLRVVQSPSAQLVPYHFYFNYKPPAEETLMTISYYLGL